MSNPRSHTQDTDELGPLIGITDATLIEVLAQRGYLATKVGEFKQKHGKPMIRREAEVARMDAAAKYAASIGLDPHFARAIILHAIGESCRIQAELNDNKVVHAQMKWHDEDFPKWLAHLKENLIVLTAHVAESYETGMYGTDAPVATKMYLDFEWTQIRHEIENLRGREGGLDVALDLGCATGCLSYRLAEHFKKVVGCDLSAHMVDVARSTPREENRGVIEYLQLDVEEGLKEIPSDSVNLVVMNIGTASDVHDIKRVLLAIKRVLKPHGRFVLSFYNRSALIYNMFVPWPLSLLAKVDIEKKYLTVTVGEKSFQVFAHFYDQRQVNQLVKKAGLLISKKSSYPTLASILPNSVLKQGDVIGPKHLAKRKRGTKEDSALLDSLKLADLRLSSENMGAYILVSGSKPEG